MIHILTHTERGGGHRENEDAVLFRAHPADPSVWLCAVADGQGGQSGGREAAELAVSTVVLNAESLSPKQLRDPLAWQGILAVADEAVSEDAVAGFASLIGFAVGEGWACGASNGDAALLLSGGDPIWLTEDQRKNPPIGSGAAIPAGFAAALSPPWRLLAMSDGVWKALGLVETERLSEGRAGEALLAAARGGAGAELDDDFTLLLIEV